MKKGFQKPMESSKDLVEKGVSIFHSQTSEAFMLIAFMIGDLFFVSKTISSPVNPGIFKGFDEQSYINLKIKILNNQAAGEYSHLSLKESINLYFLVDIVCKSFVDDTNETLKNLAIQNVKINEEEFDILRMNFLRFGQTLIEKMNEKFGANEFFSDAITKLREGMG